MVCYFYIFKKFPQFVVIHTVKGFSVVNEAEVDVFLEFSYFLYDPTAVGNLISGSSAFSKSSLNIWKLSVHVLLKSCLENFEYYCANIWRRQWHPTPVFLPGEAQGQGSLVGCRLWGCTESDTTEAT